jgi:hypothetical protein
MRYCPQCGGPLNTERAQAPTRDPLGEAFMAKLTELGVAFVDTPSDPCPECGLTVGHWSHCSHLRASVEASRDALED